MKVDICPGCSASSAHPLGLPASSFTTVAGGQEFGQPAYSILCCDVCGLVFKTEVADDATLARYYALTDFRKWETSGLYPTEKTVLSRLRQLPSNSRVLDFGCSSGRLLHCLVGRHQCLGLEINSEASAVAASKGIQIVRKLAEVEPASLDAAVMGDVFEHLSHPTDLLTEIAALVRPGGLLILATGNADSPACMEDVPNFWYFRNIEHLCMLSRGYAQFLCHRLPAQLEEWAEVCHYSWKLTDQVFQRLRRFAYRTFHSTPPPVWAGLATRLPYIGRARNWTQRPPFTCSRDHVVATFRLAR